MLVHGQFKKRDTHTTHCLYALSCLNQGASCHIGYVVQEHRSYPDNEVSGYGDNRPFGAFGVFKSQILRPDERISPYKDPAALDKGRPHPLVPAPGDPPLADVLSCRVFRGCKSHVGGDLFGGLESCHVLQFDKHLYAGKNAHAGDAPEEFHFVCILINAGQFHHALRYPLDFPIQVFVKMN